MILYFRYEKSRIERKRIADATKGVGKPKVGGKFELVDQEANPYTNDDMKGKFALVGHLLSQVKTSIERAHSVVTLDVVDPKADIHLDDLGLLRLYALP
jgi:hypothetical protein